MKIMSYYVFNRVPTFVEPGKKIQLSGRRLETLASRGLEELFLQLSIFGSGGE
jgi:hypothetical protein